MFQKTEYYWIISCLTFSKTTYSSKLDIMKKQERRILFHVDDWKLHTIIKKNYYLISVIEEILVQLEAVKYFTNIDIKQVFHWMKIFKNWEKLTTFLIKFNLFKYLIIPFGLYYRSASKPHFIGYKLFNILHYFV